MDNITITKQEYNDLKKLADKWNTLDAEIGKFYPEFTSDEEQDETVHEDDSGSLLDIGEAAARAFGYI